MKLLITEIHAVVENKQVLGNKNPLKHSWQKLQAETNSS